MINKEMIKEILLIPETDVSKDRLIDLLIYPILSFVNTYMGTEYTDADAPDAVMLAIANIISFEMNPANKQGIASESLGNYSVSYIAKNGKGYPQSVYDLLTPYVIKEGFQFI